MDLQQRQQVAERVVAEREAHGWSQRELAKRAGVAENTVSSIELVKRDPQSDKLRRVLSALGIAEPVDGSLDLEGVPEDVQTFLNVAARRLSALEPDVRARILAEIYPRLI
jgi:transcriptional regulator with XRE-family HTH domain